MEEEKPRPRSGPASEAEKEGKELGGSAVRPSDARAETLPADSPSFRRLQEQYRDDLVEVAIHGGVAVVRVTPQKIADLCRFLKEDPHCRMTHLSDLCGVDMSQMGRPDPRFDVVYHLFSLENGDRIALKAAVAEEGEIPTVSSVWRTANWHEREAFDMFGIRFAGHPDLRRILMPDDFDAYPLRKDFPLEGREKDHGYWRRPEDERESGRVCETERKPGRVEGSAEA